MDVDLSVPILLDGATATNLLPDSWEEDLCVPKWILEHPDELQALQRQYLQAGCNILYAPTFGASSLQLAQYGLENELDFINRELIRLTKQTAGEDAAVAGVLSPTGLDLEPFGEASFTELLHLFRQQASVLVDAGADLLVVETMTSIAEARAAAIALRRFHKPIFVTMTVDEDGNTLDGGSAVNALVILQELGISAFGLNCSCGPQAMLDIMCQLQIYAKIPLIAKPSACRFDEETEKLLPISPAEMGNAVRNLFDAGVTIVGGCCQTTPEHFTHISRAFSKYNFALSPKPQDMGNKGEIVLADTMQIYNLFCDQIECSEPIECSVDMADTLIRLESERIDVIRISVNSVDEAKLFAENAHLAGLPICLHSHDEISLRLALMLYTGRAMVDTDSGIEEEELRHIAQKYGAVLY
jgi:methionine synthase I (cobalamin-dependent)